MVLSQPIAAALLLCLSKLAAAQGAEGHGEGHGSMEMSGSANSTVSAEKLYWDSYDSIPSYVGLTSHSGWLMAHVVLLVVAWFFILPVGVMFSVSRSRLALPTQFVFLIANGLGVAFGTVYSANTPDLYENNAHHKIGWIGTWIMVAQLTMGLIFLYSGRSRKSPKALPEQSTYHPISIETMAQHNMRQYTDYRWSDDSGQGTERSSSQDSRDISPSNPLSRFLKPEVMADNDDEEEDESEATTGLAGVRSILRNTRFDIYMSRRIPNLISKRLLGVLEALHTAVDGTILVLGFVALVTGGVTYSGIARGSNVFGVLAHFVKGGIFFWYGLLTLGRWMGCFAELGWAWNVKPSRSQVGHWKASLPSAEFVESFVIFLYGTSNVFLEHLAAWGGAWTAQDLEHVSISIMFFGGGLCGMLVESKRVREWLNTSIDVLPARNNVHPAEATSSRAPPITYAFSMNPIPGLIILLLGLMMSGHHQTSMVSTMVHAQWGSLLVGFSFARAFTYVIFYIAPPTSIFASRPPSELISAFCLMSGGLIFMSSAKDVIHSMEINDINAMFIFTVTMGLTAFIMAWTIVVLALQGWATRRELRAGAKAPY